MGRNGRSKTRELTNQSKGVLRMYDSPHLHFSRPPGTEHVGRVHDAAQLLPHRPVSVAAAVVAAAPPAPEGAGLFSRAVTVVEHLRLVAFLEGDSHLTHAKEARVFHFKNIVEQNMTWGSHHRQIHGTGGTTSQRA